MKNNPFITVFLLVCIEVLLIKYLDYIDVGIKMGESLPLALACFFIPAVSLLLHRFTGESEYKKAFKYFTFFLVAISIFAFIALSYLAALGRAYQH